MPGPVSVTIEESLPLAHAHQQNHLAVRPVVFDGWSTRFAVMDDEEYLTTLRTLLRVI